jgi:hypothetical protein
LICWIYLQTGFKEDLLRLAQQRAISWASVRIPSFSPSSLLTPGLPACGRDALLLGSPHLPKGYTIAEHGFPPQIPTSGSGQGFVPAIKVLTVKAHGSILKAAAITGIGRANVVDIAEGMGEGNEWGLAFDVFRLEEELKEAESIGQGVIVVVTLGEVNTVSRTFPEKGRILNDSDRVDSRQTFPPSPICASSTTHGFISMQVMRRLSRKILAQYQYLVEEVKMADSLTLDGKFIPMTHHIS